MNINIDFVQKLMTAYSEKCKPLCQQLSLPQTAFDILMFLANNPCYKTASDIVEVRKIKANLVSVNVNRLVEDGYLKRESVKGDRRKTLLILTDKSKPVVEQGRILQKSFLEMLFADTTTQARQGFFETVEVIHKNLDEILKGND